MTDWVYVQNWLSFAEADPISPQKPIASIPPYMSMTLSSQLSRRFLAVLLSVLCMSDVNVRTVPLFAARVAFAAPLTASPETSSLVSAGGPLWT